MFHRNRISIFDPDRMYLKQDAISSIVEVKLYNTNSNINIESTL